MYINIIGSFLRHVSEFSRNEASRKRHLRLERAVSRSFPKFPCLCHLSKKSHNIPSLKAGLVHFQQPSVLRYCLSALSLFT